jgi:creatinine amidohydrolase/Fe(II)-dependent formamide hydrolase-like protein
MAFRGTISHRIGTIIYVLENYNGSLDSHGFEHILIFFLHSGNVPEMNAILISIAANLETQLISQ